MENYQGSFPLDISTTRYASYTKEQWIIHWIGLWADVEGSNHKQWLIDQINRIIHGTPVIVSERRWGLDVNNPDHTELEFDLDRPSQEYRDWVEQYQQRDPATGEVEFFYDRGVAP